MHLLLHFLPWNAVWDYFIWGEKHVNRNVFILRTNLEQLKMCCINLTSVTAPSSKSTTTAGGFPNRLFIAT